MNKMFYFLVFIVVNFIFNFVFNFILFSKVAYCLELKDLEGKSELELYNIAVDFYKKNDDRSAVMVCAYAINNLRTKNKSFFYMYADIVIKNVGVSPDKQKMYEQVNNIADYIINNIDYYDYRAYYYKGWVSYNMGDLTTAETNLKKSVSYFPNFLPSLSILFNIYLDRKDYDNASKIANKIISKGYVDKHFAYLILRLYVESSKLDEAKDFFDKYKPFFDNDKSFYVVSLMFFKIGDYRASLDYIEKALGSSPDNRDYLVLKIKSLYYLKRYKEAYQLIEKYFKNSSNEEVSNIKKDIEASNLRNIIFAVVVTSLFVIIAVMGFIIYRERSLKSKKMKIYNLKKSYQERVSTKSENLDILINVVYDFLNNDVLGISDLRYNIKAAIYVTDPKKENVMYCYFNNVDTDLPDVLYTFPKYLAWLQDYSNVPVHLYDIQSNTIFFEWFGAKNLGIFKKKKMNIIMPCVSRNLLQCIIFIQVFRDEEEQKFINFLRGNKEIISEILEEIADDITATRYKEAAFLDELTRLYNRRFMFQKLEQEIENASKNNQKVSFILCDIDNFKKFNDTYGHQVGDEVLRVVAKVFKSAAREFFDWPFRYGGEEIGIILPNTPKERAFEVAERIRKEVSSKRYENVPTTITISLGLATYPDDAKNIEDLIREADEALYFSKKNGKNRTTMAGVKVLSDNKSDDKKVEAQKDNVSFDSTDSKNVNLNVNLSDIKIPSFVYNNEQFEDYYSSVKSTYRCKLVIIEIDFNNEIFNKLIMDIYQSLILVEAMGVDIKNNNIIIKILFIERDDKDIENLIKTWQSKYNIKNQVIT